MMATIVLLATFYALVTEYLVSWRIAATFGLVRVTGMSQHLIVIGLGSLDRCGGAVGRHEPGGGLSSRRTEQPAHR